MPSQCTHLFLERHLKRLIHICTAIFPNFVAIYWRYSTQYIIVAVQPISKVAVCRFCLLYWCKQLCGKAVLRHLQTNGSCRLLQLCHCYSGDVIFWWQVYCHALKYRGLIARHINVCCIMVRVQHNVRVGCKRDRKLVYSVAVPYEKA